MVTKILVLEDSPERIKWFERNFNKVNFYFCKNVNAAWGLLHIQKFDTIYLDHDLGEDAQTGYDFAKILAEEIREGRVSNDPVIYIHTSNPAGADSMKSVLPQAIICPFCELRDSYSILEKQ